MFSLLAGLLCAAAILIPVFLLRRFRAFAWPIHLLAIAAAIGIGIAPGTPLLNSVAGTYVYLFAFLSLMTWGFGGLAGFRARSRASGASSR